MSYVYGKDSISGNLRLLSQLKSFLKELYLHEQRYVVHNRRGVWERSGATPAPPNKDIMNGTMQTHTDNHDKNHSVSNPTSLITLSCIHIVHILDGESYSPLS